MRHLPLFLVFLLAPGCSHHRARSGPAPRPADDARVTLRGVAQNHKVGAFLDGPGVYVDLPDARWPRAAVGKAVEVTGTIAERHDLPVFIRDPDKPPMGGIPAPPGTDLHAASRRSILEHAEWKLVRDGG